MRNWAIVGVVVAAGCLDNNPEFIPPRATDMGSEGGVTEPATSVGETVEPPTGAGPGPNTDTATTTGPVDDTGPDTMSTEPMTVGGPTSQCGNGIPEPDEDCDDGNKVDFDGCSNACKTVVCGDGIVGPGEACDDGNQDNSDACLVDCFAAACGDGFVAAGVEECDDANRENDDACVAGCKDAKCGDGFLQLNAEVCDDANVEADDGCEPDCKPTPKLYVFVTSVKYQGNLGGLPGADLKCNERAAAAGLPGTYRAWLSDNMTAAAERLAGLPGWRYVTTQEQLVADDLGALYQTMALKAPIDRDEFGNMAPLSQTVCGAAAVWTNTSASGTINNPMSDCNKWSTTFGPASFGKYTQTDGTWTKACENIMFETCAGTAPLYCFQQP